MKKKIFLGIGAVSIIVPITTVISCSNAKSSPSSANNGNNIDDSKFEHGETRVMKYEKTFDISPRYYNHLGSSYYHYYTDFEKYYYNSGHDYYDIGKNEIEFSDVNADISINFSLFKNDDQVNNVFYELTPTNVYFSNLEESLKIIDKELLQANYVKSRDGDAVGSFDYKSERFDILLFSLQIHESTITNWVRDNVVHGTRVEWTHSEKSVLLDKAKENAVKDFIAKNPIN